MVAKITWPQYDTLRRDSGKLLITKKCIQIFIHTCNKYRLLKVACEKRTIMCPDLISKWKLLPDSNPGCLWFFFWFECQRQCQHYFIAARIHPENFVGFRISRRGTLGSLIGSWQKFGFFVHVWRHLEAPENKIIIFCPRVDWFYSFSKGVKYNGILVPVRTSFGHRRRGGKTYNVST